MVSVVDDKGDHDVPSASGPVVGAADGACRRALSLADGRVEVTLRTNVSFDGAWWSCLDRTFPAGAGFLVAAVSAGVNLDTRALAG